MQMLVELSEVASCEEEEVEESDGSTGLLGSEQGCKILSGLNSGDSAEGMIRYLLSFVQHILYTCWCVARVVFA